jgi:hypothetical protein
LDLIETNSGVTSAKKAAASVDVSINRGRARRFWGASGGRWGKPPKLASRTTSPGFWFEAPDQLPVSLVGSGARKTRVSYQPKMATYAKTTANPTRWNKEPGSAVLVATGRNSLGERKVSTWRGLAATRGRPVYRRTEISLVPLISMHKRQSRGAEPRTRHCTQE